MADAQIHSLGFSGGINWSSISARQFTTLYSPQFRGSTSLSYLKEQNQNVLFGIDLTYVQKGFLGEMLSTNQSGSVQNIPAAFNYDYLALPLKVGYHTGDELSFFVMAGLAPSIILKAKTVTSKDIYDVKPIIPTFNFFGLIETGIRYKISENNILQVAATLHRSINSITTSNYFSQSIIWHQGICLQVGYLFVINR